MKNLILDLLIVAGLIVFLVMAFREAMISLPPAKPVEVTVTMVTVTTP